MAHVSSHRSTRTRTRRSRASSSGTGWTGVAKIARRIRVFAWVLVVLTFVGGLTAFILANTALSQIDVYGTVPVPGTKVLHLPAGEVDISFATDSAVNNGGSFFTPGMSLRVTPASGSGANPTVTDSSSSASTIGSQTRARVFKLQVPNAGDYRVSVEADTSAYINPQLLFGQSPPEGLIVKLGLITLGGLILIIILAGIVARRANKEAGPTVSPLTPPPIAPVVTFMGSGVTVSAQSGAAPRPQAAGQAAQLDELSKLADLHDRGVLTDAEFAAEKTKIIGS